LRAIRNLIREAELVTDTCDPAWPAVWGAEVLGHAIGHELRWELDTYDPDDFTGRREGSPNFADMIDPALSLELVGHHIADVL
jgi:hypothetical protein